MQWQITQRRASWQLQRLLRRQMRRPWRLVRRPKLLIKRQTQALLQLVLLVLRLLLQLLQPQPPLPSMLMIRACARMPMPQRGTRLKLRLMQTWQRVLELRQHWTWLANPPQPSRSTVTVAWTATQVA